MSPQRTSKPTVYPALGPAPLHSKPIIHPAFHPALASVFQSKPIVPIISASGPLHSKPIIHPALASLSQSKPIVPIISASEPLHSKPMSDSTPLPLTPASESNSKPIHHPKVLGSVGTPLSAQPKMRDYQLSQSEIPSTVRDTRWKHSQLRHDHGDGKVSPSQYKACEHGSQCE
ncbi:hypothetical protein BDV95DRAFT_606498 [Massariosphaeria phaeospora]|uniref:Uncharacterized protein n=1 Tax=Massariosphaeria phaeospora TaxID=100035 RepID=A0A7C8I6D7_9PLEO|nr:hypothetical protein BDV95DRAFT_606498 [Massariosphaeria phaeospora]